MKHSCFLLFFATGLIFWISPSQSSFEMSSSYLFDLYTVDQTSSQDGTTGIGLLLIENQYQLHNEHELYASFNFIHTSGSPSDRLGDLQVVSNIDAQGEETFKPYEIYWLSRTSIGRWMVGFIDLSNHYNLTQSSLVFIHSTFGTSADLGNTGFYGPSIYPIPSFGINYQKNISKQILIKAAVADPISTNTFRSRSLQSDVNIDPNNHFAIGELSFDDSLLHLNFGLWNYRAQSATQTDINQSGFFLDAEWKTSRLTPFLKVGFADKVTNLVSSSLAMGINFNDLLLNEETLGLGYISANIEGQSEPETVIELIYKKHSGTHFFRLLVCKK